MRQRWIPVVARVEWHSAGSQRATPVRVWFGGERIPVEVLRRAHLGPLYAGDEASEQYLVLDRRSQRMFRIRVRGDVTVVELAEEP